MDKRAKVRDKINNCTTNKKHFGSNNIWQEPNTEMEKENIEDGGNDLELPKLVKEQGMGNEVQVSQIEEIIKKVQNTRDYSIPLPTNEVTNAMQHLPMFIVVHG